MTEVLKRIEKAGIIPVVVIDNPNDAVPTAEALLAGGIDIMEITLRTDAAIEAIRLIAKKCPDMMVGAGSVLNVRQSKEAAENGAVFFVSPGFDKELVEYHAKRNVLYIPGCVTPTEITEAINLGLKIVKFFPAHVYGGLTAMKALSGPFGSIKFIPTGGVDNTNLKEYIKEPFVFAVGGSWLCSRSDINEGRFDRITELSKEAKSRI